MENGKQEAFGFAAQLNNGESIYSAGLTKREYFAAMAMQGYIATGRAADASECVRCADALLKELDKLKSE
jgi:hypothetical protein